MAGIRVGGQAAVRVSHLLRLIGDDSSVASNLRADATHWAGAVRRRMDPRDLQTIAWILLDASRENAIPSQRRRSARYWAANVQGGYEA